MADKEASTYTGGKTGGKGGYGAGLDPLIVHNNGVTDGVNKFLEQYGPQGTSDWNEIDRLEEDIDTERYSRLADKLNNQMYYKPSISYVGESGATVGSGEVKEPPKFETEDMRQMQTARQREAARRGWNMGLEQEQTMYKQNMALLNNLRTTINDLFDKSMLAEFIKTEPDKDRQNMYYALLQLTDTQLSILSAGLQAIINSVANATGLPASQDEGTKMPGQKPSESESSAR